MRQFSTKLAVIVVLLLASLGVGLFLFAGLFDEGEAPVAPPPPEIAQMERSLTLTRETIGTSAYGRKIERYTYLPVKAGQGGGKHIVFVGGIHGGYEWNSVLLAYRFMDYLDENPEVVPLDLTVTVIPSANPDGVYAVVGKEGRFDASDVSTDKAVLASGRFNQHGVDLNRNFDCKWKPKSMWQSKEVSAGSAPFSEPEAAAIRDFILAERPDAVVFWHSAANAVYASECKNGILPVTLDVMNAYAGASGYNAVKTFDSYEVTGDAEGWLASVGIPAVTVELKTHENVEWERNLRGIKALFGRFGPKEEVL
ncbi:MAG: hypothetical protein A3C93_00565 [Candidatus Lloydbacteria bacterium RIFCSPHIGHO2_02_FULL_54_17]|uniref:Peptidase M14 domain-containing protein n=1 Tax=Candidatus Lloydbacteria bacterium RIFCSPHIGHO2_02_FULL_54_17 TaxID=1798664 RepID=A0A1G2DB82_9BACT|nr:MAG: hypothetical protein A2762_02635 [Candidatus Lloydbacteria bacterium RIFCSPHIGHO2_01_FULL_54_11]OGZ10889.1 MAG: hypothetical protein A3C93_00565 [Candidatus Lloydbacteria bacterium RIFCSPHIGHO2_02_FULL_54_17]OGZ14007.1 MAG: hypothetical protein A2948_04055 [Candidatus Lloydbacteria bacterium RIFCSPLOWO2_01_FULL_54_18]OGZ16454.1 MAG: hypothetical protein A3H76_07050 [Candidatus Lloydbacteria bacterium RIFCSPLOWO2_02_FULL_54_12]